MTYKVFGGTLSLTQSISRKNMSDDVLINLHVFKRLYSLKLTAKQDSSVVPLWSLCVHYGV